MKSRVISVANHKGGVGKTTTALTLGKALEVKGKKVLLVDMDPQANLTKAFLGEDELEIDISDALDGKIQLPVVEIDNEYGKKKTTISLVPSQINLENIELKLHNDLVNGTTRLKNCLTPIVNDFDFVIIDCPPKLGIFTINALVASGELLVVAQAGKFSTSGIGNIVELKNSLEALHNPYLKIVGLLPTMVDNTVVRRHFVEQIRDNYGDLVFETEIRHRVVYEDAYASLNTIYDLPKSMSKDARNDYDNLAKEILKR